MNDKDDFLVSVLMTSYNHEKYIRQALDSVLNQRTTFKFEIIIHDDASTDNSAEIIMEYKNKYPNIIRAILQNENQYSQNVDILSKYMFPSVKGKYIAICECDDYWIDDYKLQKQAEILEANPQYSATVHNCGYVDANNEELFADNYRKLYGPFKEHIQSLKFYWRYPSVYPGQTASHFFRSYIFLNRDENEIQAYSNIRANGDVKRKLMFFLHGDVYYSDDVMSNHRIVKSGGDSWTARTIDKNLSGFVFVSEYDLKSFAQRIYNVKIKNYYKLFRVGLSSLLKYFINRKSDDRKAMQDIKTVIPSFKKFLILLFIYGILSIPTLVIILFKLDKDIMIKDNE
ncbi:MAG: glycosyltransferase family 2 protein [Bacteroidales bacterium]|nr:glycosyltransferase family 2 protein [Bacteroidales bacterium]